MRARVGQHNGRFVMSEVRTEPKLTLHVVRDISREPKRIFGSALQPVHEDATELLECQKNAGRGKSAGVPRRG